MKHCQRCNLDYPTDHRFCATCGGPLAERAARPDAPAQCAACGGTLRPEWVFCGHCRAPVARDASAYSSSRHSSQRFAAAPPLAEAPTELIVNCPSCRQPMEEGGGFCEHCGARVVAEAQPAPAPPVTDYAETRQPDGAAGSRPPLATTILEPPAWEYAEEFEQPAGNGASSDAPEVFAGVTHPVGDPATEEDYLGETAPHVGEETLDHRDAAFDDEEYEEAADDDEEFEEAASSNVVQVQAEETAAGHEEPESSTDDQSVETEKAPPPPSPYAEPRSFAYGEPLPTFGFDETLESVPKTADAGGRKWVILGGAGVATLALVVAAAVFLRQTPSPQGVSPSSTDAAAPAAETAPPAQPVAPEGMVYVPGGKFTIGRDDGDDYERPQHEATVTPFFIDKYEVTREDYQKFVAATGHAAPRGWPGGKLQAGTERWPVTGVNWADAVAYARWAGKRLPTEEEWEYAARGTDKRIYPWGNEWQGGLANADNSTRKGMAAVGEFKGASPFGAFDMVGNAWEWTASQLQAYPGGRLPKQEAADLRVIRGGSWDSDRGSATTTYRWGWPAEGAKDYSNTSFRCVKDLVAEQR